MQHLNIWFQVSQCSQVQTVCYMACGIREKNHPQKCTVLNHAVTLFLSHYGPHQNLPHIGATDGEGCGTV